MSTNANVPDAKQIFDAAMVVLKSDKKDEGPFLPADRVLQRRRAIRTRAEGEELQRKRTLAEAANALAALWHK
ncbi:MAG: hypothetical protein QOD84_159 [Acidobacteriaceae bacterium]|jgi:hypothetical protein